MLEEGLKVTDKLLEMLNKDLALAVIDNVTSKVQNAFTITQFKI